MYSLGSFVRYSRGGSEFTLATLLNDSIERDGLLMWALAGLQRLIERNYSFAETAVTRAELQRYRIGNNNALSFAEEYCQAQADALVIRSELYYHYRDYCGATGLKPLSEKAFIREMGTAFPDAKEVRDPISKRRSWRGIRYDEEGNM